MSLNATTFYYVNLLNKEVRLPNSFFELEKSSKELDLSILKSLNNLINVQNYKKIKGELFSFLVETDIINGWIPFEKVESDSPNTYDRKKHIELRKQEIDLYYLGYVSIDPMFKSHLILSAVDYKEQTDELIRRAILINIAGEKITSMIIVADYFVLMGHSSHRYISRLAKNNFVYTDFLISSDVIYPYKKEKIKKTDQGIDIAKFSINEFGEVVLIQVFD
jgi:hypothetical protein